ncbi:MAG: hypothetical protein SWO11_19600 [Thermodesulfobacteriota bacterium]|nr:hypothetical protein [Thermodesulfobacteriota bacterium]
MASKEIATTSRQIAKGTESQKVQTTDVVTAIEAIASTILEVVKNAGNASNIGY